MVTDCIASTAYDSGSRSEMACRNGGQLVPGDEEPAQQDLRYHDQRHELHGLELRARERADEQPERGAENGVGDRDDDQHPDGSRDVEVEQGQRHDDREARLDRRP